MLQFVLLNISSFFSILASPSFPQIPTAPEPANVNLGRDFTVRAVSILV